MEAIIGIVSGASQKFRRDDDLVDRFHNRYTVILLAAFAFISTTHQLVGDPIRCWNEKQYEDTKGWVEYMNNVCWVKNTYFLPFEAEIPKAHEKKDEIIYYQWIPFIFLGMALFFYLPSVLWTSFNSKAGVDSDNILETAEKFRFTDKLEDKEKNLMLITNQIQRFVGSKPKTVGGIPVKSSSGKKKSLFCLCGNKFGNYLVILYIISKLLYIGNVFAQLFVLNSVLETDFNIFGVQFIQDAMGERAFLNHTIFPKVTMCDFSIRVLGNVHRHTVMCLLTINLYTEKMFAFLWFWMVFLLFISTVSLLVWILRTSLEDNRYGFIHRSLVRMNRINGDSHGEERMCYRFVQDYLKMDGVFVLRLIRDNTNIITASEIIASTWDKWRDTQPIDDMPPEDIHQANALPLKPIPPEKPPYSPSNNFGSMPRYRPQCMPPPPPQAPPVGHVMTEKPSWPTTPVGNVMTEKPGYLTPTSPDPPQTDFRLDNVF